MAAPDPGPAALASAPAPVDPLSNEFIFAELDRINARRSRKARCIRNDPPETRTTNLASYTDLAKVHSHPIIGHTSINATTYVYPVAPLRVDTAVGLVLKSGLTPISPPRPNAEVQTDVAKLQRESNKTTIEKMQKLTQNGFSGRELEAMNAVPSFYGEAENARMISNLTGHDIRGLFEQDRWLSEKGTGRLKLCKHLGAIPILGLPDGKEAYWLGEEPIVWKILQPIIQLASVVLANDSDAAVYGWSGDKEWSKIGDHGGRNLYRVRARQLSPGRRQRVKEMIQRIADSRQITFGFFSGYANTQSWLPGNNDPRTNGVTSTHVALNRCEVWLAIELFQPLLTVGLSNAERLAVQFKAATTLLHEFAHAAFVAKERGNNEPYYEDEPIAELGFSFIDKVWSGHIETFRARGYFMGGPAHPPLGFMRTSWFHEKHADYTLKPVQFAGNATDFSIPTYTSAFYRRNKNPIANAGAPPPKTAVQQANALGWHSINDKDQYYHSDLWPIPFYAIQGLFCEELWQVGVSQYGSGLTALGPLTQGIRYSAPNSQGKDKEAPRVLRTAEFYSALIPIHNDPTRAEDQPTSQEANSLDPAVKAIDPGLPVAQRIAQEIDRARTKVAKTIVTAVEALHRTEAGANEVEPEIILPGEVGCVLTSVDTYVCPRYEEIKTYMLGQRGPEQLALDTMKVLDEPTFYRYVRDQGGIQISAVELRGFLWMANEKKELFIWEPFPGPGIVRRVAVGWPKLDKPHKAPVYTGEPPSEAFIRFVHSQLERQNIRRSLVLHYGDRTDIDIVTLFCHINKTGIDVDEKKKIKFNLQDFIGAIITLAPRPENTNFVLGPKDIVRFTFPIDVKWPKKASNYETMRAKRFADIERKWVDAANSVVAAPPASPGNKRTLTEFTLPEDDQVIEDTAQMETAKSEAKRRKDAKTAAQTALAKSQAALAARAAQGAARAAAQFALDAPRTWRNFWQ